MIAAEGGYQSFTLAGGEWFVLLASAVTALLAIAVGFLLMQGVLREDQGTEKMRAIARAIQEGAQAYLNRQFKTIAVILIPLAVIVFLTSVEVVKPDGSTALSQAQSGI
ncbi:MAG: sodium/proton-translocating pyrophosphatase, partial [Acidimicrobiia bacterium]|nr:sodium/proton-translocating pyrophosphatase [Acidimicrobiia bacterium]